MYILFTLKNKQVLKDNTGGEDNNKDIGNIIYRYSLQKKKITANWTWPIFLAFFVRLVELASLW